MGSPGFAVATAMRSHILPLDVIVLLSDTVAVGPAPVPMPDVAGLADFQGEMLPVVSLDVLLGESVQGERGWEDREWGGFALVAADGRRCILAVDRIGILVRDADPGTMLDLAPLLARILQPMDAPAPPPPLDAGWPRYLLTDVAGQCCAFRLDGVERVLDECRIVRAPSRPGSAVTGAGMVEGRILPVLDARTLLGLRAPAPAGGFVVTTDSGSGRLIVAVDRILGLHPIDEESLRPLPDGLAVSALAASDDREIWVLSGAGLADTS